MTISKLGRYDIVRILGKGAMGLVYEARDPNLDRRVAIKTIKVENLSAEASADYEARFRTEARSAARLQHPNIVSVYDSERHGDVAYLVMEYVQGDDLKQRLDGGTRYSLEQSLAMVRDLLAALDYAHRQNIVHRDVKPANLLVEASGRVKLTDFGVARIQDSGEATRTKGSMVGTLKYMSPEQVQGLPVDARADLFAAGIVLYQLLTGKRPFDGDSEFAIIHQIVSQNPPAPSTVNPQLPAALDAVLGRALAKQREGRFATAHDFSLALQEASGQAPDPTIVPPFSAAEARGASGTGSGSGTLRSRGSASGLGAPGEGATVTQELELVYWKDVKDSDDPLDLQGFMDRFPAGIYADLARRRLKKLQDRERGESSATQTATVAYARSAAPPEATLVSPNEATLVMATPAPPAEPEPVSAPVSAPAPDASVAASAVGTPPPAPRVSGEPAATPAPRFRASVIVALTVAVLAVAGIVFKMSSGGGAPAAEGLPAAGASSSTPAASQPMAPAPVTSTPAPVPASVPAVAPLAGAKPASRVASAPVEKSAAKPQATKPAVVDPAPVTPSPGPLPATKPVPAKPAQDAPGAAPALASSPEKACEGRVLLGFQSCLNEQCARPVFASHPLCVERRAAEKQLRSRQGAERN